MYFRNLIEQSSERAEIVINRTIDLINETADRAINNPNNDQQLPRRRSLITLNLTQMLERNDGEDIEIIVDDELDDSENNDQNYNEYEFKTKTNDLRDKIILFLYQVKSDELGIF